MALFERTASIDTVEIAGLTLLRLALTGAACGLLAWLLLRRARVPLIALALLAAYFPFLAGLLNVPETRDKELH